MTVRSGRRRVPLQESEGEFNYDNLVSGRRALVVQKREGEGTPVARVNFRIPKGRG